MINYFFFKLCRELNAQNELRAVLHPLPGQFTYDPESRGFAAVNTNLKVQVPLATNAIVVRSATGDIFGTEISGSTNNRARLPLYSRNEDKFYRAETLVKAENFSPAMQAAFERLMGAGTPAQSAPQAAPQQAAQQPNRERTTFLNPSQMISTKSFIESVEAHLSDEEVHPLAISRLLDKMMLGVVKFSYRKSSDDSIREAYGTRNADIIAQMREHFNLADDSPEREGRRTDTDGGHFFYFDIEKKAFRNFCTENFIDFQNCIYDVSSITDVADEAA